MNGDPAIIEIDKIGLLPTTDLRFATKQYPKATLWPDARDKTNRIQVEKLPDETQRFLVEYQVKDGCHACAMLGKATYAFHFDNRGNFTGATFRTVTPRS